MTKNCVGEKCKIKVDMQRKRVYSKILFSENLWMIKIWKKVFEKTSEFFQCEIYTKTT